ncbi:MAG: hypothetical protein ONB55_22395 [candidate division KSB1 bacterium]|nr:hypothetical protein [candidate division KSB1 bacterium]
MISQYSLPFYVSEDAPPPPSDVRPRRVSAAFAALALVGAGFIGTAVVVDEPVSVAKFVSVSPARPEAGSAKRWTPAKDSVSADSFARFRRADTNLPETGRALVQKSLGQEPEVEAFTGRFLSQAYEKRGKPFGSGFVAISVETEEAVSVARFLKAAPEKAPQGSGFRSTKIIAEEAPPPGDSLARFRFASSPPPETGLTSVISALAESAPEASPARYVWAKPDTAPTPSTARWRGLLGEITPPEGQSLAKFRYAALQPPAGATAGRWTPALELVPGAESVATFRHIAGKQPPEGAARTWRPFLEAPPPPAGDYFIRPVRQAWRFEWHHVAQAGFVCTAVETEEPVVGTDSLARFRYASSVLPQSEQPTVNRVLATAPSALATWIASSPDDRYNGFVWRSTKLIEEEPPPAGTDSFARFRTAHEFPQRYLIAPTTARTQGVLTEPVVPPPVSVSAVGGGGRIWYQAKRKRHIRKDWKKLVDEWVAAEIYDSLRETPSAKEAGEAVKPYSDDRRRKVPPPQIVDWEALSYDAERVGQLLRLWREHEKRMQTLRDDDDWLMFEV